MPLQTKETEPIFIPEKHHLFFKIGIGEASNYYTLDNKSANITDEYTQISIGYDINNNLSLELGYNWSRSGTFYAKESDYDTEYNYQKYDYFQSYVGLDNAFLRLNYKINLGEKFYLEPFLQVNYYAGSNSSNYSCNWGYSSPDTIAKIYFRDNEFSNPNNIFVFGSGISANYRISNCFTVFAEVAGAYNRSTIKNNVFSGYTTEEDLNEEINPIFTSISTSTGTNLHYNFGIKFYPGGFHLKQKVLVPIAKKILD